MQENNHHDRPAICMITTQTHIGFIWCLVESFLRHHPDGVGYVLRLDGGSRSDGLEGENVMSISPEELRIPEFSSMVARYNTFEMCNALKPFLFQYLIDHTDHQKLCYFDGDIFIFSPLKEEVWDQLDLCSILITPHLCRFPDNDQDLVWRDLAVLQHGVYNGGFIGIRRSPEAEEFIRWWGNRIIPCGYKKLEEGMNCDQRWLDLVPGFDSKARINRHPGLNAAYWNLHERSFEFVNGQHLVNGQPLKFFHFSGYSPDNPGAITKHWTRFTFENRPDVKPIFDEYRHHLKQALNEIAGNGRQNKVTATDLNLAQPIAPTDSHTATTETSEATSRWRSEVTPNVNHEFPEATPQSVTVHSVGNKRKRAPSNGSHPRVSVVIPAFNAAPYIQEAVESVLQQTMENVEIIVVDDGSTDNTCDVLAPYRDLIHYFYQPNGGVSSARNRGIQAARGDFVVFLDADDYFLYPSKLEEQIAYFEARPELGIVHSGWRVIDENGMAVVDKTPWKHAPSLDLKNWLLWQSALPSAMMFRRDALIDVEGFDLRLPHFEDVDLALRLSGKGYATAWLEKITVAYRRHSGNASLKVSDQEEALATMLDGFFAQAYLPDEIRNLERQVRYSTLVWIACQYHRANRFDEMGRCLFQSLRYSAWPASATLLDWIERFRFNYAEDFGTNLSIFNLTELDEWKQIVRSQLIGMTPDEAFFPSSGKKFVTDWRPPVGRKAVSHTRAPTTPIVTNSNLTDGNGTLHREALTACPAKINLTGAFERDYGRHRSGWGFALRSLKALHHDRGIMIDAFPEHTFDTAGQELQVAHQEPWIGFLHNPPGIPQWFIYNQSPQSLLANETFQESLRYCLGFFCLSEYHKRWLEKHLKLPIVRLLHPTDVPEKQFSMENFLANPDKRAVQIGSWLRKLHSIYYLPVTRLKRTIIHQQVPYINDLFAAEKKEFQLDPDYGSVDVFGFLSGPQYDDLLSRNIAYLELYDSSANNTIVECIMRNTPILVNPLPAVREYLGEDYPFYFANRSQAARKAEDAVLIEETHRYLQAHPIKERLTASYFLKSVAESEIYRSL